MREPQTQPSSELPDWTQAPHEPPSQPPPKLWGFRDLFFFVAFAFLALPMAYLATLGGYFLLKSSLGLRIPLIALQDNPFFLLSLQTAFYGLLLGYIYFLVVVSYRQPFWRALRWRHPTGRQAAGFLLGGIVLAFAVRITPTLLPERQNFPLERLFTSPAAAYAVGAFAILVAPFMEELIFRGLFFSILEHRRGVVLAVVITALLFAGLHVPEYWRAWNHVLMIVVVGFAFSLARGLTGSLAPSVVLHLAYNASQMTFLFFDTDRFRNLHAFLLA